MGKDRGQMDLSTPKDGALGQICLSPAGLLQTIFEGYADHFIAEPSQRALEEDAGDA